MLLIFNGNEISIPLMYTRTCKTILISSIIIIKQNLKSIDTYNKLLNIYFTNQLIF